MMLDAATAPVLIDALFEKGVAELPGIGLFRLVARSSERLKSSELIHVFPTRSLEFTVDPAIATSLSIWMQENGGDFSFPRLGILHRNFTITADSAFLERMKHMPAQLFTALEGPVPVPTAPVSTSMSAPAGEDSRSWWRRLFGIDE
ncbi:MAG: hypothetical protein JNM17_01370 [Archangium sp.]|nr:hypothetical protein [Archangium sp.]